MCTIPTAPAHAGRPETAAGLLASTAHPHHGVDTHDHHGTDTHYIDTHHTHDDNDMPGRPDRPDRRGSLLSGDREVHALADAAGDASQPGATTPPAGNSAGGTTSGLKVQIFSDLHCDVTPLRPITLAHDIDVVVVAGDTCEGALNAFGALRRIVPLSIPIVMTMGNHEFWRRCLPDEIGLARHHAPDFNIHLLENDSVVLGGVRFLGCTLWTDYRVFGDASQPAAMQAAAYGLNDHRLITWQKKPAWLRFRPQEAVLTHHRSVEWLTGQLGAPPSSRNEGTGPQTTPPSDPLLSAAPVTGSRNTNSAVSGDRGTDGRIAGPPAAQDAITSSTSSSTVNDGSVPDGDHRDRTGTLPTIVVTHHAPHWGSVHRRYQRDLLTAAFVSDLSALIEAFEPALWIHGHVHNSFDYRVGETRIICNPHGYGAENPHFNGSLVVEVGP